MCRVDRVLGILRLLASGERLNGREMARLLAVDSRTIYRDVQCLRSHGIPVQTENGRYLLSQRWWVGWTSG